jgi:hypothetical protein
MGLRRIRTISHGRLDHSRHCRRGRDRLAPAIRSVGKTETAPLPAPFLVHSRVDRPTLTGSDGSDPLWHCWRGTPARDPLIRISRVRRGFLIYRKRNHHPVHRCRVASMCVSTVGIERPEEWRADIDKTAVPGGIFGEIVFFHKKIRQPWRFAAKLTGLYYPRGQYSSACGCPSFCRNERRKRLSKRCSHASQNASYETDHRVPWMNACISSSVSLPSLLLSIALKIRS